MSMGTINSQLHRPDRGARPAGAVFDCNGVPAGARWVWHE